MPAGVAVRFHQRISSDVESHLRPCACGGRFRADASPRCPHCRGVLSPVTAASWIEANAPGTAKGWRWQGNWAGLYCILIERRVVKDPWI